MSEPGRSTFYGVKTALQADLASMIGAGSDLARNELKSRLPAHLRDLAKLYCAAYGVEYADKAMMADLERLNTAGEFGCNVMGQPPRDRSGRVIRVGEEVIITAPAHRRHGQIGEYAGLADTLVIQKYRICFDGDISLAKQGEFDAI